MCSGACCCPAAMKPQTQCTSSEAGKQLLKKSSSCKTSCRGSQQPPTRAEQGAQHHAAVPRTCCSCCAVALKAFLKSLWRAHEVPQPSLLLVHSCQSTLQQDRRFRGSDMQTGAKSCRCWCCRAASPPCSTRFRSEAVLGIQLHSGLCCCKSTAVSQTCSRRDLFIARHTGTNDWRR